MTGVDRGAPRRWPVRVLLALAVAAACLTSVCLSPRVRAATATPPNIPISPPLPPTYAYQSPSLAQDPRDPTHLAAAYFEGSTWSTCFVALSSDTGATWKQIALVGSGGRFGFVDGKKACRNDSVAYGPDATLYVVMQLQSPSDNSGVNTYIIVSRDGGVTIEAPRLVAPLGFNDSVPTMTVDQETGRVYVTWSRCCTDPVGLVEEIDLASSTDGGRSFTPPVAVSTSAQPLPLISSPAAGRGGRVYVAWLDWTQWYAAGTFENAPTNGKLTLYVSASTDSGRTFGAPVSVTQIWRGCPRCDYTYYFPADAYTQIVTGANPDDVYVASRDRPLDLANPTATNPLVAATGPGSGLRVIFAASHDGGQTFTTPVTAGVPPGRGGDDQYLPKLSISPNDRIDLAYYDIGAGLTQDVYWTSSTDRGQSFSAPVRLTDVASDIHVGPPGFTASSARFGAHLGLLSRTDGILAAWTDSRRGTTGQTGNGHQDVYFTSFPPAPGAIAATPGLPNTGARGTVLPVAVATGPSSGCSGVGPVVVAGLGVASLLGARRRKGMAARRRTGGQR